MKSYVMCFEDALKLCWLAKYFRSGDFHVKDVSRSERPVEVDNHEIKISIESNQCLTTQRIVENLNISKSSVENYLKQLNTLVSSNAI